MTIPGPDPRTKLAWLSRLALDHGDPYGIGADLESYISSPGASTLDEALGLAEARSTENATAHYPCVVEFVAAYLHRNPDKSVSAAHRFYLGYHWKFGFTRGRDNGGHQVGSLEHLCWKIYSASPNPITSAAGFRLILKKQNFTKQ